MEKQSHLLKKTTAITGVVLFFFVLTFIGGVMGALFVQLAKEWMR